jgi:hypothetical protein
MTGAVELLGDLLLVAEVKLGESVEELLRTAPLSGLETMLTELLEGSDRDAHPTAVEAIAVCAAWVIRRQPFSKYNREIGYEFMRLKLDEAEASWPRPQEEAHEIEVKLDALETDSMSEARFVEWVCLRVATA